MGGIIAVVGMVSEARLLEGSGAQVIIGGGQAHRLAQELDANLSAGAAGVLSFGLCGALDPTLKVAELVIATSVIFEGQSVMADDAWRARLTAGLPNAKTGPLAAADEMVPDVAAKARLYRATGALAVDMESHIVAALACRYGVPFAVLRAVSDTAAQTLPPAARVGLGPDGKPDIFAVLRALGGHPRQLGALIRTGRDAGAAHAALRLARSRAPDFEALPLPRAVSSSRPGD
jgi:hopanoid-associated phosphorylase